MLSGVAIPATSAMIWEMKIGCDWTTTDRGAVEVTLAPQLLQKLVALGKDIPQIGQQDIKASQRRKSWMQ